MSTYKYTEAAFCQLFRSLYFNFQDYEVYFLRQAYFALMYVFEVL